MGIDLRYGRANPTPTPNPTPIPNQVGIELRYDAPSERVCVAGIAADSPAISPAKDSQLGGGVLKVGDVLLAKIDGVRAV